MECKKREAGWESFGKREESPPYSPSCTIPHKKCEYSFLKRGKTEEKRKSKPHPQGQGLSFFSSGKKRIGKGASLNRKREQSRRPDPVPGNPPVSYFDPDILRTKKGKSEGEDSIFLSYPPDFPPSRYKPCFA